MLSLLCVALALAASPAAPVCRRPSPRLEVTTRDVRVLGSMDREIVVRSLTARRQKLEACFACAAARPVLPSQVTVKLEVRGRPGTARSLAFEGTDGGNSDAHRCLEKALREAEFPSNCKGGDYWEGTVTLRFHGPGE